MTDKYSWRTKKDKEKHGSIYHETIMVPERVTIPMILDTHVWTPARFRAFPVLGDSAGYLQRRAFSIRDIDLTFGRLSIVIVDRPISTGQGKGALKERQ